MKRHLNGHAFLIACCIAVLLIPGTRAGRDDGATLGHYRRGLRANDDSDIEPYITYYGEELYQEPLYSTANASIPIHRPKRIAIIGGGIGGGAMAHELGDDRQCCCILPDVTIFERNDRLGGRIRSVRSYEDGCDVLEAGGELFDTNYFGGIKDLAQDVGVPLERVQTGGGVHLWNGQELVWTYTEHPRAEWKDFFVHFWRNGRSLWYWLRFVQQVVAIVRTEGVFHFYSYLELFTQAATEARDIPPYVQEMHGISRLLGIGLEREQQKTNIHAGGTERLLNRLVRMSQASLKLNSTVTRIRRHENLTFDVDWTTHSEGADGQDIISSHVGNFDSVIIAAPFHLANITIDPPLPSSPKKTEYVPLHVTQFISYHPLDPVAFNLNETDTVPDRIWNVHNQNSQGRANSSEQPHVPAFITLTRTPLFFLHGCMVETENLYKIISSQYLSDEDISILFQKNGTARKDVTFPEQSCYPPRDDRSLGAPPVHMRPEFAKNWIEDEDSTDHDNRSWEERYGCLRGTTIRWLRRDFWPAAAPVVTPNTAGNNEEGLEWNWRLNREIEIAPRLFYLSAFETRDGASISGSVGHARSVVRRLKYNYIFV